MLRFSKYQWICVLFSFLIISSCSMDDFGLWSPGNRHVNTIEGQRLPSACTHRQAYANGVADAKAKRKMLKNYGRDCPDDQSTLSLIYRQGFENGALARLEAQPDHPAWYRRAENMNDDAGAGDIARDPNKKKHKIKPYDPTKWHCFPDNSGAKICGYYCQRQNGKVKCTESKSKRCVKNERGDMACGYNCTATAKTVKCGGFPEEKCLSDAYGNVQCGDDCRRVDGQVVCG